MPELQIPMNLPTGETLVYAPDFFERLHYGDATLGWVGDPRLGIYTHQGRLEVWRHCDDGVDRLIMRGAPGVVSLDSGLLRFLAEHDSQSRREFDAYEEIMKHEAKMAADKAAKEKEQAIELTDRLCTALRADDGGEIGLTRHRYITVPDPVKECLTVPEPVK